MTDHDAADLLRQLARLVAREVVAELTADDWVDQTASPLGNRRHVRLLKSGTIPGRQLGRRWLARRADIDAYLATPKAKAAKEPKTADSIAKELGLPMLRRAS